VPGAVEVDLVRALIDECPRAAPREGTCRPGQHDGRPQPVSPLQAL